MPPPAARTGSVSYDGLVFDLDDVVWWGGDPFPGAAEAIAAVRCRLRPGAPGSLSVVSRSAWTWTTLAFTSAGGQSAGLNSPERPLTTSVGPEHRKRRLPRSLRSAS